jgi:L-ascorbate metabolism protein UlaG (beta-lactamase superfamily)
VRFGEPRLSGDRAGIAIICSNLVPQRFGLDVAAPSASVSTMITPFQKDEVLLHDIETAPDNADQLHIWWLGQSGFLLKHDHVRILFDPYLTDSLTEKYATTDQPHVRMTERCIAPEKLAKIDLITSSHLHTDHFDPQTLLPVFKANPQARFFCAGANQETVVERLGGQLPEHSFGMSDGDSTFGDGWEVRGIVAAHNEVERDDTGQTRFMGFWIRIGPFRIYHSGDTMWHDDIVRDLREYGCDVAFVPINGHKEERRVPGNLNGTEAAALAKVVNAGIAIPHHFEMFEFNTASPDEFVSACGRLSQPCKVLRCGERFTLDAESLSVPIEEESGDW